MGKKKQMRSEVKGNVKNSIGRIAFAALAVLLQIGWILILMIKLYQYSSVISLLTSLFALVVALRIYGKHTNAAFKMPWIIVILAFPVFGLCIYGLFGHKEAMHKIIRKFEDVDAQLIPLNVQDETRMKIFDTARELQYQARERKSRKRHLTVGVYYSYSREEELRDTYYLTVRLAVEKKLEAENMERCQIQNLEELKKLGGLDGLLCLGTFSKSMVRQIEAFKKPTVFLDAMPKGDQFDCVVNDLESSVEVVMDYLTGLGHKKIAFIGGYEVDKDGEEVHDERMVTYKKYMERIGEFSPALVRVGSFTPEDGYVLCREILEGKEKPTAIFANNDSLAVGCYRAVSEKGLRIPEDVSIVGYNDIAVANYLVPPLTTVRLHMELLGEEAVRLLRERITSSREIGLKVIVPAKLIVRGSADRVK